MFIRGRKNLKILGEMLVTFISNGNDCTLPHKCSSKQKFKNLPVTLKWKSKEFLTTTKNVIRSIIHGKNINNYMVANIKCDMYNVHLKFNRDKRRPIGINTLSFLRRSLDSYIDCICASKVIFFDFELLKNFDFFKFYPLYSHFSYSFKKV
jgi:hypothetical protein